MLEGVGRAVAGGTVAAALVAVRAEELLEAVRRRRAWPRSPPRSPADSAARTLSAKSRRPTVQPVTKLAHLAASLARVQRETGPAPRAHSEDQVRSFAFGNVAIENPRITRAMIDEAATRLARKPG